MLKEICGHTFIADLIPKGGIVIDLGGNFGDFSRAMRKMFDARVFTVEPVPELFNRLPKDDKITNIQAAISNKNGEVEIFLPEDRCATVSEKAGGKSIIAREYRYSDLVKDFGITKIDLLKMDIECAELPLLDSFTEEDYAKISQCCVEFHDFLYPEQGDRVEELKKKFQNNGFYCIPFSLTTNGDVLFINKKLISYARYLWLKNVVRYLLGFGRKFRKILK